MLLPSVLFDEKHYLETGHRRYFRKKSLPRGIEQTAYIDPPASKFSQTHLGLFHSRLVSSPAESTYLTLE